MTYREKIAIWLEEYYPKHKKNDDIAWASDPYEIRQLYKRDSDQILNITLTRKCGVCVGEGKLLQYDAGQREEIGCDYCSGTGEETTTLGKLAEDWENK